MGLDAFARQSDSNSVGKAILNLTVLHSVTLWKKKIIQLSILPLARNTAVLNTNIVKVNESLKE